MLIISTLILLVGLASCEPEKIYTKGQKCGLVTVDGVEYLAMCRTSKDSPKRCCSKFGWCGASDNHCCSSCAAYTYQSVDMVFWSKHTKVQVESPRNKKAIDCSESVSGYDGAVYLTGITVKPNSMEGSCLGQSLFIKDDLQEFD
eukprot:sb/3473946/